MFSFVLHTWRRLEKQAAQDGPRIQAAPWMLACRVVIYAITALTVVSALSGYVNFSLFIGRTIVWIGIVASAAYLAFLVTDDILRALCAADGTLAASLHSSFGIRPSLLEQAGILVSAAFRISIAFLALLSVSAPFGPGASDLFCRPRRCVELYDRRHDIRVRRPDTCRARPWDIARRGPGRSRMA